MTTIAESNINNNQINSINTMNSLQNSIKSLEISELTEKSTETLEKLEKCKKHEQALRDLTKTFFGIEKPLKGAKSVDSLASLITELHQVFDSDSVNIEYVNHLLLSYKSNPADWKKYAKFDRYRYTRNLVDAGNGKFNLMILCWGEGHGSAIHDHADSHCFMKMLKGNLTEIKFNWPQQSTHNIPNYEPTITNAQIGCTELIEEQEEQLINELEEVGRHTLEKNGVCYINDNIGLHRVENSSNTDVAVSLHLYCPPFNCCSIFNQKTGIQTKAQVTFWSQFGEKRKHIPCAPEDN